MYVLHQNVQYCYQELRNVTVKVVHYTWWKGVRIQLSRAGGVRTGSHPICEAQGWRCGVLNKQASVMTEPSNWKQVMVSLPLMRGVKKVGDRLDCYGDSQRNMHNKEKEANDDDNDDDRRRRRRVREGHVGYLTR